MGIAFGIDLGTTNSAIAYIDERGRALVIPNRLGSPITPSVVCFTAGQILVGEEAKELQAAGTVCAAFFKRKMGDANFIFCGDGVDYSAEDLSACVLRSLADDAKRTLGGEVSDVVISVPAYFKNPQREATREAGRRAGLNVLQMINEPTAAALAYGPAVSSGDETLLVYDLGGGTFDVTLLKRERDEIHVVTSNGDHELGGKDWDDRLISFVASRFRDEFGMDPLSDAVSLGELLVRVEEAKKRLSAVQAATISIVHEGHRGRYEIDRATFASMTRDLMERTVSLTEKVLAEHRLRPDAVDGVILVGGSTRMPMVREFVERTFGKAPRTGVNVDEAVAAGAAIAAGRLALRDHSSVGLGGRQRLFDVTNHSLGMIALNEDRTSYINSIILPKNAAVPSAQVRPYRHRQGVRGGQLEVFMTQGESESPADVAYLGKYVVSFPPGPARGELVVDIEYNYDASGTVSINARDRVSGERLDVKNDPLPRDVPARFLTVPKEVAPVHVTAYLCFDLSGSMSGGPLQEAQEAGRRFLESTDLGHCSLGIVAFSDTVRTKLQACQNAGKVERAIDELHVGETGGSNDAHPFDDLFGLLRRQEGRRFAIVLTDGSWSCQSQAITSARKCHEAGIEVIAVGFGGADREFLKQVASSDEGTFMTGLGGLVETFTSIAQVLTVPGYSAEGTADGKTRFAFLRGGRK